MILKIPPFNIVNIFSTYLLFELGSNKIMKFLLHNFL